MDFSVFTKFNVLFDIPERATDPCKYAFRSSVPKVSQSSQPATLLKKKLWHRCFPVNITKFLRTPFLTEHLRWLLLCFVTGMFSEVTLIRAFSVSYGYGQKQSSRDFLIKRCSENIQQIH